MTKSVHEVGARLVELCRAGKEATALEELYHAEAVSVESVCMPGAESRETHGLDGIRAKHDWWNGAMEVHSANVDGPYPHGEDRFGVIFEMDATDKASGQRQAMKEIAVFHVADGQIVREEFFYAM